MSDDLVAPDFLTQLRERIHYVKASRLDDRPLGVVLTLAEAEKIERLMEALDYFSTTQAAVLTHEGATARDLALEYNRLASIIRKRLHALNGESDG